MCWYDVSAHFNRLQLQPARSTSTVADLVSVKGGTFESPMQEWAMWCVWPLFWHDCIPIDTFERLEEEMSPHSTSLSDTLRVTSSRPVDWVNFSSSSQISDWFFPCGLVPSIFVSCHTNVSNTLYLWQLTSNWITSVIIYVFIYWGAYWCRSSNSLEISHYLGENQVAQLPAAYWAFSFWSQTNLWVLMMIALLFFSPSAVMC